MTPTSVLSRPIVWMFDPLPTNLLAQLEAHFDIVRIWEITDRREHVRVAGRQAWGIISRHGLRIDKALLEDLPNLRIVSRHGVGVDDIDAAEAQRRGVVVANTPGVLTEEVADLALGLLIMTVRQLGAAERFVRARQWSKATAFPLVPDSLNGRRLGIFGLGRIGKAIARRAEACGMSIAYCGRTRQPDNSYRYFPDLLQMAGAVDTLLISAPGGPATHHAVNAAVLSALGPDGILVNIGRGTTVDERALIDALTSGTLRGAGLDVFEKEPTIPDELLTSDRVVLLPHIGSATVRTRAAMAQLVVDNIIAYHTDGQALTPLPPQV